VYKLYKKGDETAPWRTPARIEAIDDILVPIVNKSILLSQRKETVIIICFLLI